MIVGGLHVWQATQQAHPDRPLETLPLLWKAPKGEGSHYLILGVSRSAFRLISRRNFLCLGKFLDSYL